MKCLITFSYDGTNYGGYQKQDNNSSIQEELEKALSKINNNKVSVTSSGRTDAGVHAINAKAHFEMDKELDLDKLKYSLNSLLPDDIYIKNIEEVKENFHARYNVKSKEYIYKINMGEYNPLEKNYVYQYNKGLDINKMKKALKILEGTHNFKSFTVNYGDDYDYVRTIFKTNVTVRNNKIVISIKGNGFMRYMVRNIVGTLIEIGSKKREVKDILDILNNEDRTKAGVTAPSNGLYLKEVKY